MDRYFVPILISAIIIVVYELIRYRKIGKIKVLARVLLWPLVIEAVYLSLIAITRLPISYYTLPLGIILAVITLTVVTYKNEKRLVEYNRKRKNA